MIRVPKGIRIGSRRRPPLSWGTGMRRILAKAARKPTDGRCDAGWRMTAETPSTAAGGTSEGQRGASLPPMLRAVASGIGQTEGYAAVAAMLTMAADEIERLSAVVAECERNKPSFW